MTKTNDVDQWQWLMTLTNDNALYFILMRIMKYIPFLHIILQLLLHLYGGCIVAELLKNQHQLSLTPFLDSFSIDKQLMFWGLLWNINIVGNIKQGWVPGGWVGGWFLAEYIGTPSFNWD